MSFTMRCMAVDMFMYSKLSYPMNFMMMSSPMQSSATNVALRFITPITLCTAQALAGVHTALVGAGVPA